MADRFDRHPLYAEWTKAVKTTKWDLILYLTARNVMDIEFATRMWRRFSNREKHLRMRVSFARNKLMVMFQNTHLHKVFVDTDKKVRVKYMPGITIFPCRLQEAYDLFHSCMEAQIMKLTFKDSIERAAMAIAREIDNYMLDNEDCFKKCKIRPFFVVANEKAETARLFSKAK